MSSATPASSTRRKPPSIRQLTYGSMLLLLSLIALTSVASVLALRKIDATFAELQRLQSVDDLAEEIDQKVSDLRLAAREIVTDPGSQPGRVWEATSALNALIKKTRIQLAPDQQQMIDGVSDRLQNYREAIERITALIPRRAEVVAMLPALRQSFEAAVDRIDDRNIAVNLYRERSRVTAALLSNDPVAAEQAAKALRALPIDDTALRSAVRDFTDVLISLAALDREIAELDQQVLGAEGQQIGKVTDLLRSLSAERGKVLARDFARTLAEDKWQSIVIGTAGVLAGLLAAGYLVRRTVDPLAAIAKAIRALAGGQQHITIPSIEVQNEIGDIARAAEVFRRTLVEADAARLAAVHALAEQRLAEESYRKLFEGSIDGIYVTTPEGALLNANPALARMMGYDSPNELMTRIGDVGNSLYVNPAMRWHYRQIMERDGFVREFEYQARRRDGDILWMSDSATAIRDEAGQIIRYEGAVRDITDQKRAEQAVVEGRRLLQQVIDTVPAVINVKDRELRYLLMNRYMAGIFDIEAKDAIGRTTTELMSRYGSQKTDANDRRVLATGEGLGFYEEEYRDAKGVMRQWLVNKMPLKDAEGRIERIVTVALDIGDRKRDEQEMRRAKEAAEAALKNLKETQESLIEAEKLAALGRLVAGVAHEVNSPVGISLTVASSLEIKTEQFAAEVESGNLRRSSLNDFLKASRDAAGQLVANLNRAAELVQSFKQVAADRSYSDRRVFDLADLTEQVITSLKPGLRQQNLALSVDCRPNLIMNSYPGPYGQVLTNLFFNSVAHAFPNAEGGQVDIKIREAGDDHVEILFEDNGCGMTHDVKRRAFDPFFTTRRDQGGTGLGLHIVYSIVTNRLGGRISLNSEPGEGTRIKIVLPRNAPVEAEALASA
ncbi:multi-sensor signal transduction histidine kinase [Rhodopseudomonas faecalis]|uniref:histidine kinase n=1 Tax=Rhodopseudomonas faecalis TaxID=99655 RepID=A0A318THB7_9BRAD|nr:PAS domain S-box protein [Rhodopseudomonas faecalis]PYF03297.1 multi-sensor signal transduction histidine kinase [Rhodopseudomonas faecalis]